MPTVVAFHHVALTVTDVDTSAAWYAKTLGFEEEFRENNDGRRACVMRFPGGGYSVGLVEHGSSGGDAFDPTRLGLDHLSFTARSRDELEQWAGELSAAGIDHSEVIDIPPGAILNFKDPDGIALSLFWEADQRTR